MTRAIHFATYVGQLTLACVLIGLLVNPWNGLIYDNPMAAVGVGMLGIGLIKFARERLDVEAVAQAE